MLFSGACPHGQPNDGRCSICRGIMPSIFDAGDYRERVVVLDPEVAWRAQQDHARGQSDKWKMRERFNALTAVEP